MFALGMIALALEEVFVGLKASEVLAVDALRWQRLSWLAGAWVPGLWLLFSLCYARANYKDFIAKWKWAVIVAFAAPLGVAVFFGHSFLASLPPLDEALPRLLRLGWSGYLFQLFFLLSMVLILMNLERTLRASAGVMRWQIKFMVLGLGALFGVRIYTTSQTLLYVALDTNLDLVNSAALIVANSLIIFSLVRARISHVELHLSQSILYKSITVLFVGFYLLAVGAMAKAVTYLDVGQRLPLVAFLVFLALLGLTVVALSDQLRRHIQRFVNRHFRLPRYDYRKEWLTLTQRTISLVEMRHLAAAVAGSVAETFGVSSVTLWLLDEPRDKARVGGSTLFSAAQGGEITSIEKAALELIRAIRRHQALIDFEEPLVDWASAFKEAHADFLRDAQVRYCVPLVAGQRVLGAMTLSDRLTKDGFSLEDFDLLTTIASQAAAGLLNLKLSEDLVRAKEMEAFQTLSAFFVHDLKNLASTLSLTLQNAAAHFDNPEFRSDLIGMISKSVDRINDMCSRLSLLGKGGELRLTEADLNELVGSTLLELNGCLKVPLTQRLEPLPKLMVDPEQVQRVIVNLVLNANDAAGDKGTIRVTTEQRNGWIMLSVSDNGCGMSKEFVARTLFQPFKTMKNQGLGIGLFQCKRIVEAHKGRIEVESEEGKGSTFTVFLPVPGRQA